MQPKPKEDMQNSCSDHVLKISELQNTLNTIRKQNEALIETQLTQTAIIAELQTALKLTNEQNKNLAQENKTLREALNKEVHKNIDEHKNSHDEPPKHKPLQIHFDRKASGNGIKFIGNKKIERISEDGAWSTVLLNKTLSQQMANVYRIKFVFRSNIMAHSFCFGYSTKSDGIKNFNNHLGTGLNKTHTKGIYSRIGYEWFHLHDAQNFRKQLPKKFDTIMKSGDSVALKINFIMSEVAFYHNGNRIDSMSLEGVTSIIPAVSLHYKASFFEISQCEMY